MIFKNTVIIKNIIAYPIVFMYLVLLFNIPNQLLRDRDNYILYAYDSSYFFQYEKSDLSYLTNEPVFLFIADLFSKRPEFFPTAMGVFVGLIYCVYAVKFSKNILIFLLAFLLIVFNTFLLYPQVMQLRQGLATALFIILFFSVKNNKLKIILLMIIPFIHVAFIFIVPLYLIYKFFLSKKSKFLIVSYTAILTSFISISFFIVSSALGLRQTEQYEDATQVSLGGGSFVLHIFLLIYLYIWGHTSSENNDLYKWSLISLTFYIFSYFLIPSAGRFFVSFYPFVLYSLIVRANLKDVFLLSSLCLIFIVLFFNGGLQGMLA